MIYAVNSPVIIPRAGQPSGVTAVEYAYYREVADERRPARVVGSWSDVWARVESTPNTKTPGVSTEGLGD